MKQQHTSNGSCLILLLGLLSLTLAFTGNNNSNNKVLRHHYASRVHTKATSSTPRDDHRLRLFATPASSYSSYLATCIPGLADILAEEISDIHHDIRKIETSGNAAVTFEATREASLNILCWVRTAHRLLEVVAVHEDGEIYNRNDLMEFIKQEVDVKDLLGDGRGNLLTLSVKAMLTNPRQLPQDLSHSHFSALTVKNALCDVIREMRGDRPNVDIDTPDVPLVIQIRGGTTTTRQPQGNGGASVTLFRSLHSPSSLHRRGYRLGEAMHKASMKESLAAGLLREAGWHQTVQESKMRNNVKNNDDAEASCIRLVDPMAGSGSFVLEAAMMATDIAPGLLRIKCGLPDSSLPPVTRWKSDIDTRQVWQSILVDASQRAKDGIRWMKNNPNLIKIQANDIHPGAVRIMESSLQAAGLQSLVQVSNMDCYDMELMDGKEVPYIVVTNPPWGIRLTEDIEDSWEGLRHYLRDICPSGTKAYILSGDKSSTKLLKLKRDRMIPIQTGEQILRWIHYTIRRGRSGDDDDDGGSTIDEDIHYSQAVVGGSSKKQYSKMKSKVMQEEDSW